MLTSSGRLKISTTEDGLTSNLLILDAVKSDSGNFSCEGYNSAGTTARGSLPIEINYSSTSGLKNGTNATKASQLIVGAVPFLLFLLVLT